MVMVVVIVELDVVLFRDPFPHLLTNDFQVGSVQGRTLQCTAAQRLAVLCFALLCRWTVAVAVADCFVGWWMGWWVGGLFGWWCCLIGCWLI